ncbi:putative pectinesterase/pectinesterase inhibitor 45 [Salvia miltiorrhiza]|uniref:putative pectinesterase/pectinesterase inhibitor 45 n=1 Tax=Salvia miltiorrhiza TaxID=226208 RepID=UPI0025ACBE83|nr:putative pectinesterase/pectinesterase inhibitor 45 [Salvia miltiorrhiza]
MAFQDFDLISQRRQEEKKKKFKQRLILAFVVSVIVILLAAAAVCFAIYKTNRNHHASAHAHPPPPPSKPKTAQNVVKSVCANTDYKKTCEDSLLKEVKNNASATPMDILRASLAATTREIDAVAKQARDVKFDTPIKKAALNDCLVLLKDARDELNSSMASIKGADISKMSTAKPELNNWLSAVISYQQTCLDGFPEGADKEKMKKILEGVRMLGSNSLSVVSQVSAVLSKAEASGGSQRRLLSFDEPAWMQQHRRILKADGAKFTPNVTVAKDNTGNFTTINAALKAMPKKFKGRYVIYVKEGVYDETVVVAKDMVNVTMYGDGSQKSIITGAKNFVDGLPTFQTASFVAIGAGFMAQSLGFRNMAGPEKHQAVALRVQSDRSIFVNCRMEGYKSTLYTQTHRQFYRSCYITGTVDFIFGDAAAVFQNCMIYVRRPAENQQNVVTAQGRAEKRETTGIVLQNCKILADEKLEAEKGKFKSFLGRPWKQYSRVIIMESEIGDLIQPEGWKEWSGDSGLKTLFYAEFNNKGPGSATKDRVKWAGYKTLKRDDVLKFTVGPFLQGEDWLKAADVPVRFGMFS